MTAINETNTFTTCYTTMYSVISGCSTLVKGVYSAFPDIGRSNFPGYPIIIIRAADISRNHVTIGSDPLQEGGIEMGITAYAESMANLDSVSDSVGSALYNFDFSISGMLHEKISTSSVGTGFINNNKLHNRSFGVTFDYGYS